MQHSIVRSIAAVVVGLIVVVVLSTATDMMMRAVGVFPSSGVPLSNGPFLLATIYRTIYSVAGCYLAARLAPASPMPHALVLGLVGFAVSLVGALATWDRGPEFGPKWYPLLLVLLAIPSAWVGGALYERQSSPHLEP